MENDERTPEQKTKDNVKAAIKVIEGMFHACNQASFPLRWHDAVYAGMKFLNETHMQLLAQLTPEEIEAEKNKPETPLTVN